MTCEGRDFELLVVSSGFSTLPQLIIYYDTKAGEQTI